MPYRYGKDFFLHIRSEYMELRFCYAIKILINSLKIKLLKLALRMNFNITCTDSL